VNKNITCQAKFVFGYRGFLVFYRDAAKLFLFLMVFLYEINGSEE